MLDYKCNPHAYCRVQKGYHHFQTIVYVLNDAQYTYFEVTQCTSVPVACKTHPQHRTSTQVSRMCLHRENGYSCEANPATPSHSAVKNAFKPAFMQLICFHVLLRLWNIFSLTSSLFVLYFTTLY
jgi:hypothetical protein